MERQKYQRTANVALSIIFLLSPLIAPFVAVRKTKADPIQAPFTQVSIDSSQAPWGKNLSDLSGDGQLDIVEGGGDTLGGNIYWYQYPTWTKYQIGTIGGDDDLQIADINGDGAPDVVVNGGLYWYENPRGSGGDVHGLWTRHTIDATNNSHDMQLGDLNADGKVDVVVRGVNETGPTTLYLQGATPDSWTKVLMPNAPDGQGTAIADINLDGLNDIIGNGYWLQQPADPTIGSNWIRHDFVSWTPGASVNVADINRDGRVDIFIAPSEAGTGTLSWFQNPTDPINGTWTRHDILAGVTDIHRFHLVDMNKDGNLDLVFAEMHQSPLKRVGILYNGGGGNSWTLQTLSTNGSHNIAVGDIGKDGDMDIVGANWSTTAPDGGALNLWRNDMSTGLSMSNFTYKAIDTAKSGQTFGLNFGDMNRDGLKDVIAGHYVYMNPGGDMLGNWNRVDLGLDKDAMLTLDVNGDGQLDIIAQSQVAGAINIYWLKPTDISATAYTSTLIGTLPTGSRDFTSQGYDTAQIVPGGKPEILFSNDFGHYYFTVPPNPSAGNWPRVQVNSDGTQEGVVAGDVNGDGLPDVVGSSHTSPTTEGKEVDVWINPGTGAGSWAKQVVGTTTNEVSRVRVADVNKDGKLDIVAVDDNLTTSTGNVYWFEQTATGWVKHTVASNLGSLESMDVGDFNGDGSVDIITGDHRGNGLQTLIWENQGAGSTWVQHLVDSGKENHLGTRVSDLDGDGDLDIVGIAYDAYQTVHLWRNNATASAAQPDTTPPIISSVMSSNLAPSSASTSWTTNEASDSQVEYGTTTSYGSSSALNSSLVTTHSITLTGLSPTTTYHYRVLSKDAAGNLATSGDNTFTTLKSGAIAIVQTASNTNDTGATTSSQSFPAATTPGNTIVAAVSWGNNASISCSDSQGNTYAVATTQYDSTNQQSLGVCYALAIKGGADTVTITYSGAAGYRRLIAHEYSGIVSSNAVDKTAMNIGTASTAADAVTSTSATTTSAGDLIFGAVMDDAGTSVISAGTGFTQRNTLNNTDLATQDMVQASAGSVASTQSFSLPHRYLAHMVAFKSVNTAPPDTTPPVISAIASSNITASDATISWTTNEASDSQVQYGTTSTYGTTTALNTSLVTSHSTGLTGLAANTTYHYRVLSKDAAGNLATSGDNTFTTPAVADTTPPVISAIASSNITASDATISWTTNEASDSQVQYGTTSTYGTTTALNTSLVTSHSTGLTGLAANTTYHYRVLSKDAAGNLATSGDNTFTTPAVADTTPPVISAIASSNITASDATISWTTNEASDSQVQYGTTSTYGTTTALNTSLVTSHSTGLTGLAANTTYHYRVLSKDAAGNLATSGDNTFTTPAASPIAMVQTAGNTSNVSAKSITQAFSTNNMAGSAIIVAASWGNNATITCSDSLGNTYAVVTTQYDSTNQQSLGVCYALNIKSGANTVTVTVSSTSAGYRRMIIHEYRGLATANAVDVTAKNIANGTTTANAITSTAAATTTANELLFGAIMDDTGTNTTTAGTGFTKRNNVASDLTTQDKVQATTGSATSTATFSAAHRYLSQMIAFKAAQ